MTLFGRSTKPRRTIALLTTKYTRTRSMRGLLFTQQKGRWLSSKSSKSRRRERLFREKFQSASIPTLSHVHASSSPILVYRANTSFSFVWNSFHVMESHFTSNYRLKWSKLITFGRRTYPLSSTTTTTTTTKMTCPVQIQPMTMISTRLCGRVSPTLSRTLS